MTHHTHKQPTSARRNAVAAGILSGLCCADMTFGMVMTTCCAVSEPNCRPSMPANVTLPMYIAGPMPLDEEDDQSAAVGIEGNEDDHPAAPVLVAEDGDEAGAAVELDGTLIVAMSWPRNVDMMTGMITMTAMNTRREAHSAMRILRTSYQCILDVVCSEASSE